MRTFLLLAASVSVLALPCPAFAQDSAVQIVITPVDGSTTTTTATPAPASTGAYVPPGTAASTGGVYAPDASGAYTGTVPAHSEQRTNWAILGSGIGLFAGGWVLTWLTTIFWYSFTTDCTSSGWWSYSCTHVGGPGGTGLAWSFLPVVGPWLMLTDQYLDSPGEMVFPVLAGLVQDVGLILFILGLVLKEDVWVEEAPARAAGDWRLNASAGPGSAIGTFDLVF